MSANITLHMIGNSHIDPVWFWRWPEGFQEIKATFKSALDRMEEFEDFTFTCSSVLHYKWIQEIDGEMFQSIKKRVKEGRWHIVGGWWVEPDCNLPSGESFVRQGLYSQRYLKNNFGEFCKIAYNIDSFGHNPMLPQILKKSGFDYYVFMRPNNNEKQMPSPLFKWRSLDGTELISCRIPGEYTSWFKETTIKNIQEAVNLGQGFDDMVCFYGVGNHGGGPTIANIKDIYDLQKEADMPELKMSSLKTFFEEVDTKNLPVYEGELQKHSVGCYSVDSEIKKMNRRCENLLCETEKINTLAAFLNKEKHMGKEIEKAWEKLLFNQFHDILAGTSIEEARLDAIHSFGAVIHQCENIKQRSIHEIAKSIKTDSEDGFPLILFNMKPYDCEEWIELEIPWDCKWPLTILNDKGEVVQYQRIMTSCIMLNKNFGGRRRLIFKASIPAMGYVVYRVVKKESELKGIELNEFSDVPIEDNVLDNNILRVQIDEATGGIRSILNKALGYEALDNTILPIVLRDEYDTWGHNVSHFNEVIGCFKLIGLKKVEHGVNRQCIRLKYIYGKSTLDQFVYLYKDADYIIIKSFLDYHEKQKMVKLRIPLNVEKPRFRCEIPYGYMDRESYDGHEEVSHSWVNIWGKTRGFGSIIANDSKYSYDLQKSVYNLTISRSPVYAHHIPTEISEDYFLRYVDQGEQQFTICIRPHKGDGNSEAVKISDLVNSTVNYLLDTTHSGTNEAKSFSFVSCDDEGVRISVLKKAEDDDSIIIRLQELEGRLHHCKISLHLYQRHISITMNPCEIKTLKIETANVKEVNMLEL